VIGGHFLRYLDKTAKMPQVVVPKDASRVSQKWEIVSPVRRSHRRQHWAQDHVRQKKKKKKKSACGVEVGKKRLDDLQSKLRKIGFEALCPLCSSKKMPKFSYSKRFNALVTPRDIKAYMKQLETQLKGNKYCLCKDATLSLPSLPQTSDSSKAKRQLNTIMLLRENVAEWMATHKKVVKRVLTRDEVHRARELFETLDIDQSESLDLRELQAGYRILGKDLSLAQVQTRIGHVDTDDLAGEISFEEFLHGYEPSKAWEVTYTTKRHESWLAKAAKARRIRRAAVKKRLVKRGVVPLGGPSKSQSQSARGPSSSSGQGFVRAPRKGRLLPTIDTELFGGGHNYAGYKMADPEIPFHLFVRDFHRSEKINAIIQGKQGHLGKDPHEGKMLSPPNTKIRDLFSLSHNKTPREKQAAKLAKDAAASAQHPHPPSDPPPDNTKKDKRRSLGGVMSPILVDKAVENMATVHMLSEKTDSNKSSRARGVDVHNIVANRKKKTKQLREGSSGDGSGVTNEELNIGLEMLTHWGAKGHTRAAFELQTQALQAQATLPCIESLHTKWAASREKIKLNYVKRIYY
jgi:hypothetical protein